MISPMETFALNLSRCAFCVLKCSEGKSWRTAWKTDIESNVETKLNS